MSRQRRSDTKPELALRRAVWARGLRYRVDYAPLTDKRRKADLVFTRARVAVFVDGCFWHRCPEHATAPKSNATWWREKLEANVARDRDTDAQLDAAGWTVVRVWEHEDSEAAAERVVATVGLAAGKKDESPVGAPLCEPDRGPRATQSGTTSQLR